MQSFPPQTTDVPLCRGLIQRTEAGRKHCEQRSIRRGWNIPSSEEPMAAFRHAGLQEKDPTSTRDHGDTLLNDDQYDNFYYFDGVLRRVPNDYKRQRRRKMSSDNTESSDLTVRNKGLTRENLINYVKRLALRNKASHMKWRRENTLGGKIH